MIPLPEQLVVTLGPSDPKSEPHGMDECHSTVFSMLLEASHESHLLYVEADFWGGWGEQAAMLVHGGEIAWSRPFRPVEHIEDADEWRSPISEGLRLLGVDSQNHIDAFDAVGLQRHRKTEGWLTEPYV